LLVSLTIEIARRSCKNFLKKLTPWINAKNFVAKVMGAFSAPTLASVVA